jgi:hypothetical protein
MGRSAHEHSRPFEDISTFGCCLMFLVTLFVVCCIYYSGYCHGVVVSQWEAVKADAGRWVIDPQTGIRSFKYGQEK